ncbi:MAG: hypothetical protein A3H45_03850 [Ignavibacteria bacterium RIFCSPLOWO2_02_FULL_55_14]|nr:MAG: hypothetical protein A3H45_03850 [Ignavibacteria bacterium RIFCSPLOWO2_02_FULL_55_14]
MLSLSAAFVVQLGGCSLPFLTSESVEDRFHRLADSYLSGRDVDGSSPRTGPVEERLSIAEDSFGARRAGGFLEAMQSVDTSSLTLDDKIDWMLLNADMRRTVRDLRLRTAERSPGRYLILGSIDWAIGGDRRPTDDTWRSVLTALRRAPIVMKTGRQQLHAPPPLWVRLAVNAAERYCGYLDTTFPAIVAEKAPVQLRDSLTIAASASRDALERFRVYLRDTLVAGHDDAWAVGEEHYNWLLEEYHHLPYTAESMIEEGRRVHRETQQALMDLARRIDPVRSWQELVEDMKRVHPQPGAIIAAYEEESGRAKDLIGRRSMITIPPAETLIFVPTAPALRETYAWGGYGGIVQQNSVMTGRFFVTDIVPGMSTSEIEEKLRTQNTGWITVIALHEGYPGHHLQSVYSRLHPHPVRSRLGSTYFGEGWALFCESWMGREGFFTDRWDSLGWLQMRLWRTARVIIDPSIHTGRMTYDQAVEFFIDEVGLERSAAEAEVNRYTTWPTQAPSYIIGWLEIERLKADMARLLGDRFTEKQFVESLLRTGSLPLALMRRSLLEQPQP